MDATGLDLGCGPGPRALSTRVVREIDRRAIEVLGLPGLVLMENAGRAAAEGLIAAAPGQARQAAPERPVVILCGPGNNGGDGHVIARHLAIAGLACVTWSVRGLEQLSGDARCNALANQRLGLEQRWLQARDEAPASDAASMLDARFAAQLASAPIVVDALLGTGQSGELRPPYAELVRCANAGSGFRAAVDVPTGLDAETGEPGAAAFRADWTATFVAPKLGFSNQAARAYLGRVEVFDIGLPAAFVEAVRAECQVTDS